jgi:hypothetical protein
MLILSDRWLGLNRERLDLPVIKPFYESSGITQSDVRKTGKKK